MKIVEINTAHHGSTGKIMVQIARTAESYGHEAYCFSRNWPQNRGPAGQYFGYVAENIVHHIMGPVFAKNEFMSTWGTRQLIKKLDRISPDIVHLHNLHGWYINIDLLFQYLKKKKIRVVWTLHDCWAFTGQCPYFVIENCDKWKTGCYSCPSFRQYPHTYIDRTQKNWKLKKECFTGVDDLMLVTPSKWLAELVQESYLKDYPVQVINNGIDLAVFKPTESNFREQHQISSSKKLLLGVAFGWGARKGLDVFIELAKRLDPDKYQIVLVGTDDCVDQQLPNNIISIHRTQNQKELAEIYTAADLFVNPTREENYPTVNMESIACGTPVLTFRTGGSPEILDETCGSVVDCDDIDAMESEIHRILNQNLFTEDACLRRAASFDMSERFREYINLYENIR